MAANQSQNKNNYDTSGCKKGVMSRADYGPYNSVIDVPRRYAMSRWQFQLDYTCEVSIYQIDRLLDYKLPEIMDDHR